MAWACENRARQAKGQTEGKPEHSAQWDRKGFPSRVWNQEHEEVLAQSGEIRTETGRPTTAELFAVHLHQRMALHTGRRGGVSTERMLKPGL